MATRKTRAPSPRTTSLAGEDKSKTTQTTDSRPRAEALSPPSREARRRPSRRARPQLVCRTARTTSSTATPTVRRGRVTRLRRRSRARSPWSSARRWRRVRRPLHLLTGADVSRLAPATPTTRPVAGPPSTQPASARTRTASPRPGRSGPGRGTPGQTFRVARTPEPRGGRGRWHRLRPVRRRSPGPRGRPGRGPSSRHPRLIQATTQQGRILVGTALLAVLGGDQWLDPVT